MLYLILITIIVVFLMSLSIYDFKLSEKYQERIDKCFKNRDDKNCERIFKEIIKM